MTTNTKPLEKIIHLCFTDPVSSKINFKRYFDGSPKTGWTQYRLPANIRILKTSEIRTLKSCNLRDLQRDIKTSVVIYEFEHKDWYAEFIYSNVSNSFTFVGDEKVYRTTTTLCLLTI